MTNKNSLYRKPRILLLNSTLGIGGAENVSASLCRGLDRDRFDVAVAHLKWRGQIGDSIAQEGLDVVSLEAPISRRPDYFSSLRLRRFLVSKQIDLVHSNDLHAMIDAAICRMSLPELRVVNTFHYGNYPQPKRRRHLVEKYLSRIPDSLVAVGYTQKEKLTKVYGLSEHRLRVIRNGVCDQRICISDDLRGVIRNGKKLVIGSVSTLIEQKGVSHLIDVASILKRQSSDFQIVIVGDGVLRSELEAKAKALGVADCVTFMGWVGNISSRVLPWIDIFVQTSLWEAMSMVVLEAMSYGLPVVATSVGENPYVIDNGVNGFLVPAKATNELAIRLLELIQSDSLRRSVGERARQDWQAHYTATQMCRQYGELYGEVLSQGERKSIRYNAV